MYIKRLITSALIIIILCSGCVYDDSEGKQKNAQSRDEVEESEMSKVLDETKKMEEKKHENYTDEENLVDGGGALGLTEQYVKSTVVSGQDYVVTEDMIRELLFDNEVNILQNVEQAAEERGLSYNKENVSVYIKGISPIHIDKDVWLMVSSKEIPILLGDKVMGIFNIDNPNGRLSINYIELPDDNMFEQAISDNSDSLLVAYNVPRTRMLIDKENKVYSDVDISDIYIDNQLEIYETLFSEYAVIPKDIIEQSVNLSEIVDSVNSQ